jgi:plasmid maintenance system killer protein
MLFICGATIWSFADAETERFFATGETRRLLREILRRAAMRLRQLDAAATIEDLRLPPSNRLEALKGDRAAFDSHQRSVARLLPLCRRRRVRC